MGDLRSKFMEIYFVLKAELLNDPAFEFTDTSRHWVDHMVDYNVPTGKLNRGISVIDSYKLLFGGKELSDEEFFLASALGWCIEWLQAYLLVLDDIEDNSHLRRGQPCWFRLPQIGMVAVNDGIVLRNHIWRILKNHFRGKPYYVDLLDLFNEVEFQTISGQMIDLITTLDGEEGEKDLSKYSLPLHRRIVQFKTSYYSFYLPVACALLMAGENLENHIDVKNTLVDMGIYYQVQDDYLDSFGDPEVVGKVGTDIEDFKCSWLVVKALECCNDEQKKLLYENYGKADQACVAKVKELYNALDLQAVFTQYESESHEKLIKSIEAHPSKAVQAVLKSFLAKIYKRQNSSLGYNMNMGSVDRAASDDQISSLSSWRYKQVDTNSELDANSNSTSANKEDPECCICLAKYREKEEVRQLPCSHLFHLKYVDQWFRIISCCPLCIQELDRYKNKNM